MTLVSAVHHAAGANIKGTPAMPAAAVRHDLKVLRKRADVLMLQEFKWPWYWSAAMRVLDGDILWSSSPAFPVGQDRPVVGAQGITWNNLKWKKIASRMWPGFDFRVDTSGIMDNRWIRAVLLEDRKTGQKVWFFSTHFVVGGDRHGDGPVRQRLLDDNIGRLVAAVREVKGFGYPIICELDANIARDSAAYGSWMRALHGIDAKVIGTHGVEYLFVVQGRKTKVDVIRNWIVPTTQLRTDHETRGLTYRLVG